MLLFSESISFTLIEKLAKLNGIELIALIVAAVLAVLLLFAVIRYARKSQGNEQLTVSKKGIDIRALVVGAMCISVAFVLSYMKIFSMPLGGSLTILSMLPICVYACWYGPKYGLLAAFAYGLLQMIQGVWIVHPAQFVIDYLLAFTVLGLAAFFPENLPLGVAIGCFARFLCSTISGAVFFAESASDAGFANPWVYSAVYNFSYIGVEGVLCVIVAAMPFMKTLHRTLPNGNAGK